MGARTLYIIKRTGFGRNRLNLHAVDAEERPESYKLSEVVEAFGWAKVIKKKDLARVGVGTAPREAIDLAEAEQNDRIEKANEALKDAAKCLKRIREIRAEEYPEEGE